ncbi:MAG: roadblock/LC7 domain-containing protein [bacterium]
MKHLVLDNPTIKNLDRIVRDYMVDSGVSSVFIVNTAGQMLYHRGMAKSDYMLQSIGALEAGIFNATKGMAKLIHEDYFTSAFQQGRTFSFYYYAITDDIILISIYGKSSIIGVVQVSSKNAANSILSLMKEKADERLSIGDDFKAEVESMLDDMFK